MNRTHLLLLWIAVCVTVLVVVRFLTIYHVLGDGTGIS